MAGKTKTFTWEEVAKHNTPESVLLSIEGKVYDVTGFVEKHPGGKDQLLRGAGRDVSAVFRSYHKDATYSVLERFYVGDLTSNELPVFPPPSAFYKTLKTRVDEHFTKTGKDPKWAPWMLVRYVVICSLFVLSFLAQMKYADNYLLSLPATIVLGVCGAMIGLMPMHDGSHFSFTHNPLVWKIIGYTHDILNGASSLTWTYQHTLGHHPYTNIDHADPDILTQNEKPDIRRIKGHQKWFSHYLHQNIWAPAIYGFLAIKTRIQDIPIVFTDKLNGSIRVNNSTTLDNVMLLGGKLFFVIYRLVFPCFFLPVSQVLIYWVLSDLITSWYLALAFQCSHVVGEVDWPLPDKNNRINQDWAEMQITTTLDYATDSWLTTILTGALNHQTCHHLFPGMSQFHYMAVTPIIKQTCKEFGVRYNCVASFAEALGLHLKHLYNLSTPTETEKKAN